MLQKKPVWMNYIHVIDIYLYLQLDSLVQCGSRTLTLPCSLYLLLSLNSVPFYHQSLTHAFTISHLDYWKFPKGSS